MRLAISALLAAVTIGSAPPSALAQDTLPRFLTHAGAAVYGGDREGPMLFGRWLGASEGPSDWGLRVEFRDERAEGKPVFGGGGEVLFTLCCPGRGARLYVPASLMLDLDFAGPMGGSLYPRADLGLGLELPIPGVDLLVEVRRAWSAGGNFTAVSLAAGSRRGSTEPSRAFVQVYQNGISPFGSTYRREGDFNGYTVAYEWRVDSWADALRGSLGLDYLDFSYSTGLIHLMFGPVFDVVGSPGGAAALSIVPQVGRVFFAEGRGGYLPVIGMVGLEARAGGPRLRAVAAVSLLGAGGPDGWVSGIQHRVGLAVGL